MKALSPLRLIRAFGRELAEGVADITTETVAFLGSPSRIRKHIHDGAVRRRDTAIQMRLNRQVRSQFMQAFNQSARKKVSLDVNQQMRAYNFRNGVFSKLLRPYEWFSTQNMPVKIVTAVGLFKIARIVLFPVVGAWGIVAPLALMLGGRMALVYRDGANKKQETLLSQEGMLVPPSFTSEQGTISVMNRVIAPDLAIGFPVLHTETPQWVVSRYDDAKKSLQDRATLHAATFEALRRQRLSWQDLQHIKTAFVDDGTAVDCACALSLIFPQLTIDEIIAETSALSTVTVQAPPPANTGLKRAMAAAAGHAGGFIDIPLTAAILQAVASFCQKGADNNGLHMLAGKADITDLRYLAELHGLGHSFSVSQGAYALRMMKDPRFSPTLTFRQICDVALWPAHQAEAFDDLWKDSAYRTRFGFDALKDMTLNLHSWGGVALRLAGHPYTSGLQAADIRELAQPENAHWAKAYHHLCITRPDLAADLSHSERAAAAKAYGFAADVTLTQAASPVKRTITRG